MTEQRNGEQTPSALTFIAEATPRSSREGSDGALGASDDYLTYMDEYIEDELKASNRKTDATEVNDASDIGSTNYAPAVTTDRTDHARPSTSRAGTEKVSCTTKDIARGAETAMAEERNSVNTPPAFTFGNEATLSRSQELFEVASSTSDCCTTIPVATGVGPWNTHYLPADGTSTVSGHTHNTETGSAGFTLQAYSSSSGGVDNTVASTSFPPMEQPSDMPGNDTWSATGADAGVQQEFSGACSIVCSSRDALHGRANEHTGDTDQICKSSDLTSVSNSMFIKHCRKSTDGNHKCETCDTSSHLAPPLAAHDRSHEHRSPYHCHICNKSFQSCRHLDDHKRIHKGDKPYTCETCGKSLTQVSHLRAHQQTDATEKPHVCHKCTKPFECKSSLQRHLKWYCGGGDFDCRICHLSFVDSSDLFRHHQMFHGYEMPHECTHCGFDFAEKEALDEHLRRNHMCDLCGATFEDTIQLIKHIWTNSCGQP